MMMIFPVFVLTKCATVASDVATGTRFVRFTTAIPTCLLKTMDNNDHLPKKDPTKTKKRDLRKLWC